jgi:hypothetical protein
MKLLLVIPVLGSSSFLLFMLFLPTHGVLRLIAEFPSPCKEPADSDFRHIGY